MQHIVYNSLLCFVSICFLFFSCIYAQTPTAASDQEIYHRAYTHSITTAPTITDANLDGVVYRKIAAKMLSEFAINTLGHSPDTNRICAFNDIDNEIDELKYYIKLSCQLGIMGLDYYGNPDTTFNPNHFFTRDQLVTAISRIYFGTSYNIQIDEMHYSQKTKNFFIHTINNITHGLGINKHISSNLDRYTKHMKTIKKLGIINNYFPGLKEHKIHVLRILYTLNDMGYEKIKQLTINN